MYLLLCTILLALACTSAATPCATYETHWSECKVSWDVEVQAAMLTLADGAACVSTTAIKIANPIFRTDSAMRSNLQQCADLDGGSQVCVATVAANPCVCFRTCPESYALYIAAQNV